MGCVNTITYDKFPKQKDKNYKYQQFKVGSRVKVCYHYDTSKYHYGIIVRDDLEEPFETIIKLDNGRYLRATECQFTYVDNKIADDVCEWRIFDNSLTDEPQWVYETTCGKYVGEEHTSKAFVYCPYCSKKIKVVE